MPVFNLCLKIIRKNLPSMAIYMGIFLIISLMIGTMSSGDSRGGFEDSRTRIAFLAAEETPLVAGLRDQLSGIADFVEIRDEQEALQDALYFREIQYILRVPKGFTDSFLKENPMRLEKSGVPSGVANVYIDMKIEQYLNLVRLYSRSMPQLTGAQIVERVSRDMAVETQVQMKAADAAGQDRSYMMNYFNYLAYTFMSVVILGISAIMLVFNDLDIKRRNACAPMRAGSVNLQFMMANGVFTLACWVLMVGFCLVFDIRHVASRNTLYFILNAFAFALCASGISFLVGSLAKGREAITAITNVITMGPCFISGVFVPQAFIGADVLRIASFTPTYWYVRANARIAELTDFGLTNLRDVFICILIQVGFAAAFFAVALVLGKGRRLETTG